MASAAPRRLESYVYGAWTAGKGDGLPLLDAGTGEPVALIDSKGLDFAEVLHYGRTVAGPKLRAMSFHERAAMLKALGLALMGKKEEFYAESFRTGATRADGWVDIEGGIGTMLTFASKGRRELPNTRILTDGDVEPLSKDNSFSAQHIYAPLQGVAVHINAFNFPIWGMLEKISPTLLAGVPAVVKPASQTAYLTELMVRRIIETGLLPEGALQLISGSVGDLLDHVTGQDVVTFTGSAWTGRKLKAHPAVIANSVRFTMEADSLNASILGPDATPGTPEFDLFVKEVAREMTVKAGQKCTAIRRVIAPRDHVDALVKALGDMLGKTALGLPDDESDPHGAACVAPPAHRSARTHSRICCRTPRSLPAIRMNVRVTSGDAEKGAFLNPILLYADDPFGAVKIHDVEAFGPVSTVLPYDFIEEAVELARLGKGSLVSSVFTDDPKVAEEVVIGVAPFHGRVLVGNRRSAKTSTGPRLTARRACPWRSGPRRRRRGNGRHAGRKALHAAHRSAGHAASPVGRHRALDRGG